MRQLVKEGNLTWVDIQHPTRDDIEYLRRNYNLDSFVLDQLYSPAWRPKLEVLANNYLLLILYYPFYTKEKKDTSARELDILIAGDTVITFHYSSILPLKSLFNACNVYPDARRSCMGKDVGHLTYVILNSFWEHILLKLTRINRKIDLIEKEIFEEEERTLVSMVREISLAKADILDFWRIVEPQGQALSQLRIEGTSFFSNPGLKQYFSHILDHYHQAVHDLENYRETMRSLEQTNNSLLTTKTNETVKILAIFSALLLPLTLIASIFGMNTNYLPFTASSFGSSYDFWIVVGIMGSILAGVFLLFKKRKWI